VNGANINEKYYNGYTALMFASENGHIEAVKYLLRNGANLNEKDNYDYTALILASREGHIEVVKSLLQNGADPMIRTDQNHSRNWFFRKMTALEMAREKKQKGNRLIVRKCGKDLVSRYKKQRRKI